MNNGYSVTKIGRDLCCSAMRCSGEKEKRAKFKERKIYSGEVLKAIWVEDLQPCEVGIKVHVQGREFETGWG